MTPPEGRSPETDPDGLAGGPPGRHGDEQEGSTPAQLLTFLLGDRMMGCPLDSVREIVPVGPATRLPGAPPHVLGILNLRGTLLTVLDAAGALAHDDPSAGPASSAAVAATPGDTGTGQLLVIEVGGRLTGFRVSAVHRVYPMPPLTTGLGRTRNGMPPGIVLGYGEAGDRLVAVLDLPALARQTLLFPGER